MPGQVVEGLEQESVADSDQALHPFLAHGEIGSVLDLLERVPIWTASITLKLISAERETTEPLQKFSEVRVQVEFARQELRREGRAVLLPVLFDVTDVLIADLLADLARAC
ncbi:hypothetical protein [Nesterenkonia ebinurensis]|uniref:hypothetical protein n=1 Tax=Nesterenkonia ebinurensis TaxID=2608252 RepID=UPI00123E1CA1|nr:hypothetical protein [Nesterenkonia ebinurensis]